MIAFWVTAGVLSAAAAILILFRAARAAAHGSPVDTTSVFYRRQLAEIGDLADRGLLGADERKSAEIEASRRLLAAADQVSQPWSTAPSRVAILVAAVAAPALALGLYLTLGSPGAADQPFAGRLAQWTASDPRSLDAPEIAAVISSKIKEHPTDPEGYRFLAMAEGASNNPAAAVLALKRAVRLAPQRGDLWEMLGEAEIYQAGDVTEEAKQAFVETLKLDPSNVGARYQLARARIRAGDKAGGLAEWRAILAGMPAADPHRADLMSAIAEVEGTPAPPPQQPGLSADQMTAVRGMVANLAQRLAASPDDPAGWVQLVKAYAVLGDLGKRDAALKTARARFAAKPDVLDALSKAAATEQMK
jgi:cytochrome c-type biogenesis protein CcmH